MRFYYNGNDRNTGAVENDRHIRHHAAADDLSFCHEAWYYM